MTDEDLRAAFRLRATGTPDPGLRRIISDSARLAQGPRDVPVVGGVAHGRPILARLVAAAAVAGVAILAPLVVGEFDAHRLDLIPDSGRSEQTSAAPAFTDGDDDHDDDDVGDDEDGRDDDHLGEDDDLGDDD